jgi:hypothetical protein
MEDVTREVIGNILRTKQEDMLDYAGNPLNPKMTSNDFEDHDR